MKLDLKLVDLCGMWCVLIHHVHYCILLPVR